MDFFYILCCGGFLATVIAMIIGLYLDMKGDK